MTAGIAVPLTIAAAGIAVLFLATTVAEFTRAEPSAGSFITYVETGLGARTGMVTAPVTVGYTVAITGLFTMAGGLFPHADVEAIGAEVDQRLALVPPRGNDPWW